jgi:hypothetical protein
MSECGWPGLGAGRAEGLPVGGEQYRHRGECQDSKLTPSGVGIIRPWGA